MRASMHTLLALAVSIPLGLSGCDKADEVTEAPPSPENASESSASMQAQQPLAAMPAAIQGTIQGAPERIQVSQPAPIPALDTSTMVPAQILDRQGFRQPMVVADLQIPKGWRSMGGVSWNDNTNCVTNQLQWTWTALAPDSLTAIEKLSGFNWQVQGTENQFNPCPSAPFRNARAFLESMAMRLRPGAQILRYEAWPEAAQQMQQKSQGNVRWDAGQLLIGYQQEGIPMHELLKAAVSFTDLQGSIVGGTGTVDAQRAPAGRLDPALNKRVGDTIRLNPQWAQAARERQQASMNNHHTRQSNSINDWHNRQMAAINARGEADRAAIRMRTNREVANIYSQIAGNTSATNDRMQDRSVRAMREVDAYQGVDGRRVESSIHGGSRVFQDTGNPQRTYSTDDPYHRPPNAVELQRVR
ncbi:hypothetical protein [Ottowia thiooxydans]|uniref:hypothetical protein n=1 Tax=Ottowia thiooxydans TaxID=219182 RepID=UPI000429E93F|nr:hypothetical protein [Ottowia thiooxydans]